MSDPTDAIRARHVPASPMGTDTWCMADEHRWPCETAIVLTALDAALAERDQQERFKWAANERADALLARLAIVEASDEQEGWRAYDAAMELRNAALARERAWPKTLAEALLGSAPPKLERGSEARRQWLADILAVQVAFGDDMRAFMEALEAVSMMEQEP